MKVILEVEGVFQKPELESVSSTPAMPMEKYLSGNVTIGKVTATHVLEMWFQHPSYRAQGSWAAWAITAGSDKPLVERWADQAVGARTISGAVCICRTI